MERDPFVEDSLPVPLQGLRPDIVGGETAFFPGVAAAFPLRRLAARQQVPSMAASRGGSGGSRRPPSTCVGGRGKRLMAGTGGLSVEEGEDRAAASARPGGAGRNGALTCRPAHISLTVEIAARPYRRRAAPRSVADWFDRKSRGPRPSQNDDE